MTSVLIFGASGLLGHQLARTLVKDVLVAGTSHHQQPAIRPDDNLEQVHWFEHVDVRDRHHVEHILKTVCADVVINCVGLVKSRIGEISTELMTDVNQSFPRWLADQCEQRNCRLIQISTDCVYSGRRGHYSEADPPDPVDLYGQTKLAGEPQTPRSLVLRTSFIGEELETQRGLLAWLSSQRKGRVQGYNRAIFSGVTTNVLSEVIRYLIQNFPLLSGTWHVAGPPIDKYQLLQLINDSFGWDIQIEPDPSVVCDRSLDGRRFCAATGFQPPAWSDMVIRLAKEFLQHSLPHGETFHVVA